MYTHIVSNIFIYIYMYVLYVYTYIFVWSHGWEISWMTVNGMIYETCWTEYKIYICMVSKVISGLNGLNIYVPFADIQAFHTQFPTYSTNCIMYA